MKEIIYEKLKFYCPSKPCDNIKDSEEYRLFMKLFGPFGFLKSPNDLNLYNACFSYFMTIFNNDECPAKKNICTKSDYIKVMFYGGTNDTIYNSKCGHTPPSLTLRKGVGCPTCECRMLNESGA